jgi:hypothetical protein
MNRLLREGMAMSSMRAQLTERRQHSLLGEGMAMRSMMYSKIREKRVRAHTHHPVHHSEAGVALNPSVVGKRAND